MRAIPRTDEEDYSAADACSGIYSGDNAVAPFNRNPCIRYPDSGVLIILNFIPRRADSPNIREWN